MIEMVQVKQEFVDKKLIDIKHAIRKEIQGNREVQLLPRQSNVAVTAGSRGITNIVEIIREVVLSLKEIGLNPFIVPAMGSHGGATAEGQVKVLDHLGINEESVDAPIVSSMEVEWVGYTPNRLPVYMDQKAYHADGIIVINRVKTHTAFHGKVESGLSKMVTIGLGKIKGASFIHSNGALNMAANIEEVSKYALENTPILMGLAIVENGYDQTAGIYGIGKEHWHEEEAKLLRLSKTMMPSLPIENIDLLIVEEMGKTFSGTGMDPNIIGRWRIEGVPEPDSPQIKRIAVLDLAEKSFGNAQGVGLADFTTQKLIDKIDRQSTYANAMTSTYLQRAMLPLIYLSERETIETSISSLGPEVDLHNLKIIQIPNTLHLNRIFLSKPALHDLEKSNKKYTVKGEHVLTFDLQGHIVKKITC